MAIHQSRLRLLLPCPAGGVKQCAPSNVDPASVQDPILDFSALYTAGAYNHLYFPRMHVGSQTLYEGAEVCSARRK